LLLLTIEDNFCEDLSRLRVDVEELLPFISGRVDNGVRDLQNRAKTSSYHKFTSSQSTVEKKINSDKFDQISSRSNQHCPSDSPHKVTIEKEKVFKTYWSKL
jgi:hypothetical protein